MKEATGGSLPAMEEVMPDAFAELVTVFDRLEAHYRDMQDIEFTVQDGRLWILQTRSGKRTTHAALKIAVDMAEEGLIDRDQAVARIDPRLATGCADARRCRNWLPGLPASPGAVLAGGVNADDVERMGRAEVLRRDVFETSTAACGRRS
jgi:pyruvate,orthophosphate dikinase